jgi:DNA polymerase I-like protein with 3'-5' exonuclease and polymerase domains
MTRLRLLPPAEVAVSPEQAVSVLEYLMNRGGRLAIDTETTGLDKFHDRVLFWSMATEDRRYFFPAELLSIFTPLFRRRDLAWYLANAKYDMHQLANGGVELGGEIWDIVCMDATVDDTRPHGLKEQIRNSYGITWGEFKDLFLDPDLVGSELGFDKDEFASFRKASTGDKLLTVYGENPEVVIDYATCDAFFTYYRGEDLRDQLAAEELPTNMVPDMASLLDYYRVIEMPLTKSLWRMERTGLLVDRDYAKKIDGPMRDGIAAAQRKIWDAAGTSFNVNSSDDLRGILYGEKYFGLTPLKYTAGGAGNAVPQASTDEKTLNILRERLKADAPAHRFISALLNYRSLKKLHGTYVKEMIKPPRPRGAAADPSYSRFIGPDGRVHSSLNQSGARTSRLSSSDPNLQNIPIRNDPFKIRGIFIAPSDELLVDLDYPQIEFRVAAVLANERQMMDDIRKGWDIHSANAANMFGEATYEAVQEARRKKDTKQPLSDFDRQMLKCRDGAKAIGLGTMYGEGARKIAATLGISVDEARDQIDKFFRTYSRLAQLIDDMHSFGHENEFTHTMLGRKRRLHKINNEYNQGQVKAEERQSFNTLIQGTSAEMIKLAILRVDNDPRFRELGGKLLLTVHDELIASAPKDSAKDCLELMKELMGDPYRWGPIDLTFPVPIDPDGSTAPRWSEAK